MTPEQLLTDYKRGVRTFVGADLRWAYLEGADLKGADLKGANLEGADLRRAYLEGANLEGADLRRAYLEGANLEGANLEGANLRKAYLREAYLRGADLAGSDLEGANLAGANLEEAGLNTAVMPDGRVWEEYQKDHLAGICDQTEIRQKAIAAWGRHSWTDCPMHCALGIDSLSEITAAKKRLQVAAWITLYDAELLEKPQ